MVSNNGANNLFILISYCYEKNLGAGCKSVKYTGTQAGQD
jgi:hypothetical protein